MAKLHIIYDGDNNGAINVAFKIPQKVIKTQHSTIAKTRILKTAAKGE